MNKDDKYDDGGINVVSVMLQLQENVVKDESYSKAECVSTGVECQAAKPLCESVKYNIEGISFNSNLLKKMIQI